MVTPPRELSDNMVYEFAAGERSQFFKYDLAIGKTLDFKTIVSFTKRKKLFICHVLNLSSFDCDAEVHVEAVYLSC